MSDFDQMADKIKWMPPDLIRFLEKYLRKLPSVKKEIDSQTPGNFNPIPNYLNRA